MNYVEGDIIKKFLDGSFEYIIQGCNCFNTMGGGLARQLAEKFPQVPEADNQTKRGDRSKLGSFTIAAVPAPLSSLPIDERFYIDLRNRQDYYVVNAYTQYLTSHEEDVFEYDAFDTFLLSFETLLRHTHNKETVEYETVARKKIQVGFPMIGSGLANGDWKRIEKSIYDFSERCKEIVDVTIVKYQPSKGKFSSINPHPLEYKPKDTN